MNGAFLNDFSHTVQLAADTDKSSQQKCKDLTDLANALKFVLPEKKLSVEHLHSMALSCATTLNYIGFQSYLVEAFKAAVMSPMKRDRSPTTDAPE